MSEDLSVRARQMARDMASEAGRAFPRSGLPQAYGDPAFVACLRQAVQEPELLANFDRLYGASLVSRRPPIEQLIDQVTGKLDDDLAAFAAFVHESIYLRLGDEAIGALRLVPLQG